jgi:very-short-patch-repair endonuclease
MRPEQRVIGLAARQHSAIARRQAVDLGMSEREIDYRLTSGKWLIAEPGTYVIPGSPTTWERTAMVAVLATGPSAVISHFAAGWLWGLTDKKPAIIDITVPHGRSRLEGRGRRLHQASGLQPRDVTVVNRIPLTSKMRTLLDLASVLPGPQLEAALDKAVHNKRVPLEHLAQYVADKRTKGVAKLRRLIHDRRNGIPESELERAFERVMKRTALPMPERQHTTIRRRVDYAYRELWIAIELDGYAEHGDREAFREDRRRQNALVNAGWTVLRFTWEDLKQRPDYVAATIRTALAQAATRVRMSS